MLSNLERVLFIVLVIFSSGLSFITYSRMFKAIGRGTQAINWIEVVKNWPKGLSIFLSQKTLFKSRTFVAVIHAGVAWGFSFYLIVNIVDVFYGMVPDFHFLPNHFIGHAYRLFVDIFTMLVLFGVLYFLARRFLTKSEKLKINEPVLISERAKKGIRLDSILVGTFIIFHVGFRFIGASAEIALNGNDWYQPGATVLATFWSGLEQENIVFLEHLSWWISLGLIMAFFPYFPYSKHRPLVSPQCAVPSFNSFFPRGFHISKRLKFRKLIGFV